MAMIIDERFALPAEPFQQGGHAQLFRGTDLERDNQTVAIKLFNRAHLPDDKVLRASWTNELSAYQALGIHENLVRLIDWGRTPSGEPYLIFDWFDSDLFDHLNKVSIEGWDDFWPIGRDILAGLAVIHSAGYVHRDLKPENILVSEGGSLKVADFGTARLVQTINLGTTMAPFGTDPYCPPERGTTAPSFGYDLYSFAVICIVAMTGRVPAVGPGVVAEFESLDLPETIAKALRPCLADTPEQRPESAEVLLATLAALQDQREKHRQPEIEVFLFIPTNVTEMVEHVMGLPVGTGIEYVTEDLTAAVGFAYDDKIGEDPDLQISGEVLFYRTQPHRRQPGVLHVMRAFRPPAQVLEAARSTWYRPNVRFRFTIPTDPPRAQSTLLQLQEAIAEHDAARVAAEAVARQSETFGPWRKLLRAKFAVEDERGAPVRYNSFSQAGTRIRFKVSALPALEIGESRLVRVGPRRVLFGEVEGAENNELILYVTKGRPERLPRTGVLEFDAEASKSKLRREQAALDRITGSMAARPDLKDILLDPRLSATPSPVEIENYFNPNLDDPKKLAVSKAVGAKDVVLVQGPPGTGKTTFISEVVAQLIRANPQSRILLASQTHIALDNALARVRELRPEVQLVRLGRFERITSDIEDLSLTSRLEAARAQVIERARAFLRSYAATLGINLEARDVEALAAELSLKMKRVHSQRSRIALRQAERRQVAEDISHIRELAPGLLDTATALEQAAAKGSGSSIQDAVQSFIDVGIKVAASLEAAAQLNGKLVQIESTLATWRRDLNEDLAVERGLAEQLAQELGQPTDTALAELLDLAASRKPAHDPRLDKLRAVAEDWEARFGRSAEFSAVVIAGANVVAATCVGLAGVPGAQAITFDVCIIDEASKATATEALVPLASSRRWIFVGDDRQLPPFVENVLESPDILKRFDLTRESVRQTLFQVMADGLSPGCRVALTHQHRMNPAIGQLISECFYGGTLTSEPRETPPWVRIAFKTPVLWADTHKRGDRRERGDSTTFRNRGEARVIVSLLDRLQWVAAKQGVNISVAVLTAYDAQRRELAGLVEVGEGSRENLEVRVANVDAYQGQEADVTFFSITRSNPDGELGFLKSPQRINVALSRAREALIIVGDSEFIRDARGRESPLLRVLTFVRSFPEGCSLEEMDKA